MINCEDRGSVSILRLARGKGNALNLDLLHALIEALDRLEASPARAGIITASGNIFCAGVDLPALAAGGASYIRQFLPVLQRAFERVATFPKPLVAAVNGHAIAGGLIITLGCDQRLLVQGTARVGLTEVRVGVMFPAWALEIARYTTPVQHFSTLISTGRTWPATEAQARGLVDELVEPKSLMERACEVAQELAAIATAAFRAVKLQARQPMIESARRQQALTDAAVVEHWCQPETLQHVTHFAAHAIKQRG